MLSRAWNFVKRHHRKGLVASAVVGGGVLLTRYGIQKFQEQREKEVLKCLETFRREKHYVSTQQMCQQTILSLVNNLRSTIMKVLNSDELTLMLKLQPPNKLQLWEELKLIAFTRVIISVYGSAMFVLLLQIQINIVGGLMYLNSTRRNEYTDQTMASSDTQAKFLECVQYFVNDGLRILIDILEPTVKSVVGPVLLKEKLKLENLDQIFTQIRQGFENGIAFPLQNLAKFAINEFDSVNLSSDLKHVYDETVDILNSEDSIRVLSQIVDVGFAHVSDLLTDYYLQLAKNESHKFVNPHESDVPLAKLIPVLNNYIFVLCSPQPKHLVEMLLQYEHLKSFGANIYEAFSQPCKFDDKRSFK